MSTTTHELVAAGVAADGHSAANDSTRAESSMPPELVAAIAAGSISFDDVADVHFKTRDLSPSDLTGQAYRAAYGPVLAEFRNKFGTIERMTFGTRARWAVCLTVRPWGLWPFRGAILHYYVRALSFPMLANLLAVWMDLRIKALRIPDSQHRYFLLQRLYDAFWNAIQLQEALFDSPPTMRQTALTSVWEQLRNADEAFTTSADRSARLAYLEGMGISVVVALAAALGAVVTIPLLRQSGPAQTALLCVLSGCLGAGVSVLFRLSQGTFVIKRGESLVLQRWFGGMRPLLGASFALVLYELVFGGMVPLKLPTDDAAQLALIGFLGFAAGFSEMLVPNLIAKSIKNLDAGGSATSAKTVAMVMATGPMPTAVNGSAYSARLIVTGGTPPYTWTVTSGDLPAELSLSPDGTIAGRPQSTGSTAFQVSAADAATPPQSVTANISITVVDALVVGKDEPRPATLGDSYAETLKASGGVSPYTWSLVSGSLPDGLEMITNGNLLGTPKTAGSYLCRVRVQDSTQPTQASFRDLSIRVA
jgi:Putative Ig domain